MKFVDIFFIFLGTIGLLFGVVVGSTGYTVSAICIILSAIMFVDTRKKTEII